MTGVPPRIALATHNPHKLRELARICADWPTSWASVETHDPAAFPDVEETGDTYLDNARLKAVAVAAALDLAALRTAPTGSNGFGYDPIFEPVGRDVTMAELADTEKDRISHRGRAFRALREAMDATRP